MESGVTKVFVIAVLALGCFTSSSYAQDGCPTVKVTGPSTPVKAGSNVKFVAKTDGGDRKINPTYEWHVSASGRQISIEKRRILKIDTTGITAATLTATITISTESKKCHASSSFTVYFEDGNLPLSTIAQ